MNIEYLYIQFFRIFMTLTLANESFWSLTLKKPDG